MQILIQGETIIFFIIYSIIQIGQIISILDLRKKLNIKPKEKDKEEAVVIVELQNVNIGLIVDSINKVLQSKLEDITEVPEIQSQINTKYIQGVFRETEKLTILLDLEKVLNIEEIIRLKKASA